MYVTEEPQPLTKSISNSCKVQLFRDAPKHSTSGVFYQTIGKIAGLNVLIDPDFSPKTVTVDLKSVTALEALRVLGDLSNTFWKASTHNTIYVAGRYGGETDSVGACGHSNVLPVQRTQQNDANDIITALRNMSPPSTKVFAVQTQNAILIRATTDEIMLAMNLIASRLSTSTLLASVTREECRMTLAQAVAF